MAIFDQIVQALLSEFVAVILGIFFVHGLQRGWNQWRHGGWEVVIMREGKEVLRERISADRRKDFSVDRLSSRVYLKGLASSYDWLNCDLLVEGEDLGLFCEDKVNQEYVIDLDKNPERKPRQTHISEEVVQAIPSIIKEKKE